MSKDKPLLKLEKLGKQFDGNYVLQDINIELKSGEILGLVGENGAGKSTLMKILFGMTEISETGGYEGKVFLEGEEINFASSFDALGAGIGMVHQEFSLIPGFTAMENILLNTEPTKKSLISRVLGPKFETLDDKEMRRLADGALQTLGVSVDIDTLVADEPVGHKQFVEIAREIKRESVKLLVFDEPTAVLTESEAEVLLAALRKLADQGIGIIFITHRLAEVLHVCDTICVLRDGKVVGTKKASDCTLPEIAEMMVGRDVDIKKSRKHTVEKDDKEPDIILRVDDLWVDMPGEFVRNVSFTVERGEIFGIGGLAGQGKLGIPNGIMGLYPGGGQVLFNGEELPLNNALAVLKKKLAFVSEDRRGVGLLLDEPIDWNITFSAMQVQNKYLKSYLGGLIKIRDDAAMRQTAKEYINALEIRCTSERQHVRLLSGGNQQKICLVKAFALEPELLFVSEPTRGIDVGAKELVLNELKRFSKENGVTIIMVSSELEELRSICNRIAIVCDGKIAGILDSSARAVDFGLLMAGSNLAEVAA